MTEQNAMLCLFKNALHKPTSDGHDATRDLWKQRHRSSMALEEAVQLCRLCHQMAPFCFFNGNTFVAVIRDAINLVALSAPEAAAARSLAGHIVAGVASAEEEQAFREFCESIFHLRINNPKSSIIWRKSKGLWDGPWPARKPAPPIGLAEIRSESPH